MPLDPDIAAAPDALALDRIKAQDYRNSIAQSNEDRDASRALEAQRTQALVARMGLDDGIAKDLLPTRAEVRLEIVKAIAVNYMKPTTGTLPETIAADTRNDAARLLAAVDAIEAIVNAPAVSPATPIPGAV